MESKFPAGLCQTLTIKLITGVAVGCALFAQASDITEQDLIQDVPMVTAATRLPQSVEASPGSITVLDRQLIAASGFVEIGDLFRLVPGFQVARSWRDHHTVTTYHGQTDGLSRRMQVLVDGRTAFTSQFGLVDWDRLGIAVHDIERIEVMRGPAGSAYGSNAFVAAINIVTRKLVGSSGSEFFATTGSADTELAGLRYHQDGEQLRYSAYATYLGSDGFDGGNSGTNVFNLRVQGEYQLGGNRTLDFQVLHADGPSGRGGTEGSLFDPVGLKEIKEQNALLRFTDAVDGNNQWYLQLALDRSVRGDLVQPGTVADVLAVSGIGPAQLNDHLNAFPLPLPGDIASQQVVVGPFNYRASRIDLEAQQTYSLSSDTRLVWGAGWRRVQIQGGLVLESNDTLERDDGRLLANWEHRRGNWIFNLGGLYESGDLSAGDLSSRVGANYQLSADHTLRASFSRGWRRPFIGEAYHELAAKTEQGLPLERFLEVGPQPLTSEKITTWELGYLGNWGGLRAEVKLFDETLENEIQEVLDPTAPELISLFAQENNQPPGVLLRINGGRTKLHGLEGNLDYQFGENTRMWLSYAYTSVDQDLPPLSVRSLQHNNQGTPRHTASMLLSHNFTHNLQASLGYYYLDDTAWFLFGSDTEHYDRVDLRLATTLNLWSQPAKLEFIGQNIVGGDYSEFNVQNSFERMLFVRFSLPLN